VPLIHWEQALGRIDREPLAESGTVIGGAASIDLLNNPHPVTVALPAGTVPVYSPAANMRDGPSDPAGPAGGTGIDGRRKWRDIARRPRGAGPASVPFL
jgi:hypothetical protein